MLNELLALERGLTAAGVAIGGRHQAIKDMAKGGVVRVRLRAGGSLDAVEYVPDGGRGALWTLRDGQHNGFPGLKLPPPDKNSRLIHEMVWKEADSPDAKRAEVLRFSAERKSSSELQAWPKPAYRARIVERLSHLKSLESSERTAAVPAAFTRFLCAVDAGAFVSDIFAALAVNSEEELWLDCFRDVLLGTGGLAIDVAADDFARDAGDPRQIEAVSQALQECGDGDEPVGFVDGKCVLSGASSRLLDGNFPQPNLPGLGQTYLFSRNKDIPALSRYGHMGPDSLPVDAVLASRLSGVVLALTAENLKGRTWNLIPAESGDKPDLLIVSIATDLNAKLADAMTTESPVATWPAVVQAAEDVLQQTEGFVVSAEPQEEMRLLVLRTIDPANRKAVYEGRSTVQALHLAATRWAAAMRNVPNGIAFPIAVEKKVALRRPPALPPISLVWMSRRLFANGGKRRVDVTGLPASEAFGLFLAEGATPIVASRVLALLVKRHHPLLAGIGHAKARGGDSLKGFDPTMELRRDALRSVSWIGAMLLFVGRPKETYMTETAYKLGQLLAAADAVHIGYCADMRGGNVPPTLLGNAVFAIAGRDPIRALDILCGRWKPYGAWARRTDHVLRKIAQLNESQLAWHMRRGLSQARLAAPLCADLQGALAGTRVNETFRAELLLGYLAGLEREPKAEEDSTPAITDSKGKLI